jgi:hypothetical protein
LSRPFRTQFAVAFLFTFRPVSKNDRLYNWGDVARLLRKKRKTEAGRGAQILARKGVKKVLDVTGICI